MYQIAAFGVALALTMALIPLLMRYAAKLHLLDLPNDRKVHAESTPRVGGICMILGVLLPLLLWLPKGKQEISLLIGIGILFVFGVWDDRGNLDYRLKFLGQFIATVVVVGYGRIVIHVMPFFGFDPVPDWLAIFISVIVIVGVTNSVNLSDGLDGLAAGLMLLSFLGTALLAYLADGSGLLTAVLAIIGAMLGFLRFNTYPARVFMGDTGSQFLGYSIAVLLIMLTQKVNTALNPALPLLLLGIPLFDTAFVTIKRIYTGKSPFVADKNHIHHQLLGLRFDHYEAVVIIYLMQAIFVSGAILLRYYSDLVVVSTWLFANIVLATAIIIAGRKRWYFRKSDSKSFMSSLANASHSRTLLAASSLTVTACLMAMLLAGPLLPEIVSIDFGVAASVLFVFLLLRMLYGGALWFVSLRLIFYMTTVFVLFLVSEYSPASVVLDVLTGYGYFGLVVIALLVGSRFTINKAFRITPMDFLLVFVLVGIFLIPQAHIIEEDKIHLMIKAFILFYAIEFALSGMKSHLSVLSASMLFALGVIAVRGILS